MGNCTTAVAIFLLTLAAFAWLAPQSSSNPQIVTRLGLTVSIVKSGHLEIDRFADRTVDKARWNGHYYADKLRVYHSWLFRWSLPPHMLSIRAEASSMLTIIATSVSWQRWRRSRSMASSPHSPRPSFTLRQLVWGRRAPGPCSRRGLSPLPRSSLVGRPHFSPMRCRAACCCLLPRSSSSLLRRIARVNPDRIS